MDEFDAARQTLVDDSSNAIMRQPGWKPVYTASPRAKIVAIGQAPGRKAQMSGVPWNDGRGKNLIE